MQRYENENLNTIILFLLSSVSRFFGAVFLRLLAHMRKYCIEVFGSHHSEFRAGNEMPGCGLQLLNFIRYCPSGRARGSFLEGVLCLGVFSKLSPCGVRVCNLLLYSFGGGKFNVPLSLFGKNTDHTDAAFGCSDQSLSLPSVVNCCRSRFVVA